MPHASRYNFIQTLIKPQFLYSCLVVGIPLLSILFEFTQIVYTGTSRLAGR
jgi:hypothetical protein